MPLPLAGAEKDRQRSDTGESSRMGAAPVRFCRPRRVAAGRKGAGAFVIVLNTTRQRMLEDLHASTELLQTSLSDSTESGGGPQPEVRLLLRKTVPYEILPALNSFLPRHCPHVPPESLERDLLRPLKKAVGNAYK